MPGWEATLTKLTWWMCEQTINLTTFTTGNWSSTSSTYRTRSGRLWKSSRLFMLLGTLIYTKTLVSSNPNLSSSLTQTKVLLNCLNFLWLILKYRFKAHLRDLFTTQLMSFQKVRSLWITQELSSTRQIILNLSSKLQWKEMWSKTLWLLLWHQCKSTIYLVSSTAI